MRRVLCAVLLAVLVAACTDEGSPTVGPDPSTSGQTVSTDTIGPGTTPASDDTEPASPGTTVRLTPGEVLKGGDPDGSGTAVIRLVPERAEVCYDLSVSGIALATSAHLHRGETGQDGPAVLSFTAPDKSGTASNCAAGDSLLLEELESAPSRFYVDIHNAAYPMGALRGQLGSS